MEISVSGFFLGVENSFWLSMGMDLLLKGSLLLALGLLVEKLLFKSSASARSSLWTVITVLILLIPFSGSLAIPQLHAWPEETGRETKLINIIYEPPAPVSNPADVARSVRNDGAAADENLAVLEKETGFLPDLLWLGSSIWVSGVIIFMMITLYKLISSRNLLRNTCSLDAGNIRQAIASAKRKLEIRQRIRLLFSRDMEIPCVTGLCSPVLILPASATTWDQNKLNAVLLHELAHVRRKDTLRLLLLDLATALSWMNPLVWLAARKSKLEMENSCDDFVINAGVKSSDYAMQLFHFITLLSRARKAPTGAVTMARKSTLESRVSSILDKNNHRKPLGKAGALAFTMTLLLIAVPLLAMKFLDTRHLETTLTGTQDVGGTRLEELLRYFPETNYQEIYHKDFVALKNAENSKVFRKYFEPEVSYATLIYELIPEESRKNILSITVGRTVKTKAYEAVPGKYDKAGRPLIPELTNPDGTINRKKVENGMRLSMFEQDDMTVFGNHGANIAVVRYEGKILNSIGKGTEVKEVDGQKIYKQPDGYWVLHIEPGVMLMANKLDEIKAMIQTSKGEIPCVTEMTSVNELRTYSQDLGPIWKLTSFSSNFDYEIQYYTNKLADSNIPEKRKKNYRTILRNVDRVQKMKPLVFAVDTFKAGSVIEKMTMELCGDKQAAKRRFDKSWTNTKTRPDWGFETYMRNYKDVPESKAFHNAIEKSTKRDLDGRLIIARATIDDGLLKLAQKARAGIDKWRQQQKEKVAREAAK